MILFVKMEAVVFKNKFKDTLFQSMITIEREMKLHLISAFYILHFIATCMSGEMD